MDNKSYTNWEKDQVVGILLFVIVFVACCYHNELANILGNILHYFLG